MLKNLFKDAGKIFSGQMIGLLLSVTTGIILARTLGPDGRGIYAWMATLTALAMQMSILGGDITSKRIASANAQEIPKLLTYCLSIGVLGSSTMIIVAYLYAQTSPIGSSYPTYLMYALLSIPFLSWATLFNAILIAANKAGTAAKSSLYGKLVFIVIILGLFLTENITLHTVMCATVLGNISMFALIFYIMRKQYSFKLEWNFSYLKGMWKYSASAYASAIFFYIMFKVDVIMVGDMLSAHDTGLYGIAASMSEIMLAPATALGGVLMVKLLSNAHGDEEKCQLYRKALMIISALVMTGCIFTALIAPFIIPFMFGEAFTSASRILQILCPAVFFLSLYHIEQNRISAWGKARSMVAAPAVGAITNVSLNLYLIPLYGTTGAAWATVIAFGLAWLCAFLSSRK